VTYMLPVEGDVIVRVGAVVSAPPVGTVWRTTVTVFAGGITVSVSAAAGGAGGVPSRAAYSVSTAVYCVDYGHTLPVAVQVIFPLTFERLGATTI
jgi:hypothetical protein